MVFELPPRSAVRYFPSAIVSRMAFWIRSAVSWRSKWRNIVTELSSKAVGFAKFCINPRKNWLSNRNIALEWKKKGWHRLPPTVECWMYATYHEIVTREHQVKQLTLLLCLTPFKYCSNVMDTFHKETSWILVLSHWFLCMFRSIYWLSIWKILILGTQIFKKTFNWTQNVFVYNNCMELFISFEKEILLKDYNIDNLSLNISEDHLMIDDPLEYLCWRLEIMIYKIFMLG